MQSILRKITGSAKRRTAVSCLCAVLLFLFFCASGPAFAKKSEEYAVKAAFILNFAKFSQWPEEAFMDSGDSLTLCIIGEKSLKKYFKQLEGKKIGKRTLTIRYMEEDADVVEFCHMLFISEDVARSSLDKIFASIEGKPVLSIGETENFASNGGVINLVSKGKKLRFEINRGTAVQQQIELSSRLLKLAIIVNGDN